MKSELSYDADVFDAMDGSQVKSETKNVKVEKTEMKPEHAPIDGVSLTVGPSDRLVYTVAFTGSASGSVRLNRK